MVFLFYELAYNPMQAEKLYAEVRDVDITDSKTLQNLLHLNGLINETLRIHPPVPSGGYRETPSQGVIVAGRHIPGNTTIVAPRYTIGRLESCFEKADQFIPERWYSSPSMVKNKRAFTPFSQGRYSCVGKNLALAELRYVTALVVGKYSIEFAPGEDGGRVEGNMKDQFTAAPGTLNLVFKTRKV
ncbi:hypothetical protein MMC32_008264 [Xylographa parallela]|nr:hypothetical protein [Xylographa parallela]